MSQESNLENVNLTQCFIVILYVILLYHSIFSSNTILIMVLKLGETFLDSRYCPRSL